MGINFLAFRSQFTRLGDQLALYIAIKVSNFSLRHSVSLNKIPVQDNGHQPHFLSLVIVSG